MVYYYHIFSILYEQHLGTVGLKTSSWTRLREEAAELIALTSVFRLMCCRVVSVSDLRCYWLQKVYYKCFVKVTDSQSINIPVSLTSHKVSSCLCCVVTNVTNHPSVHLFKRLSNSRSQRGWSLSQLSLGESQTLNRSQSWTRLLYTLISLQLVL